MRHLSHCILPTLAAILSLLSGCQKYRANVPAPTGSPTSRHLSSMASLREELVSSPEGWSVLYFPRCDSLLFSNPDELIRQTGFRGRLGYGGSSFVMRFGKDGRVEMRADFTDETCETPRTSLYSIKRGSATQLSFETYSYIHTLVNDAFRGASDFIYLGHNAYGQLIFGTAGTILPAREYMIFTKIRKEGAQRVLQEAYANRRHFEQMANPQLSIRMGDRIYFESDNYIKRPVETNRSYLKELEQKRYYLFLYNKKRNPIPGYPALKMTGLGSGYAGTPEGLTFRPGLRYGKDMIFMDFERVGDHFEAELVRVYNPHTRSTLLESRHLHPEGEPTGVVAKIWDAPIPRL